MAHYVVRLRGEHFPLYDKNRWKLFGFYIARNVNADSAEEAEMEAVQSVQTDPVWAHVRPRPGFPTPRIYPEEVEQTDQPVFPEEEYEFFRMRK